jgi:ParB family chromosome partitioning protein
MAEKAQELLAGSGWLPEPLRTPGHLVTAVDDASSAETGQSGDREVEDTAEDGGETAMAESEPQIEDEPAEIDTHAVAAE